MVWGINRLIWDVGFCDFSLKFGGFQNGSYFDGFDDLFCYFCFKIMNFDADLFVLIKYGYFLKLLNHKGLSWWVFCFVLLLMWVFSYLTMLYNFWTWFRLVSVFIFIDSPLFFLPFWQGKFWSLFYCFEY